jgi:hypothetical protein
MERVKVIPIAIKLVTLKRDLVGMERVKVIPIAIKLVTLKRDLVF